MFKSVGSMGVRTLLVMDSEPAFVRFVERTAKLRGFAVTVARTGEQFRQAFRDVQPDVIVLGIIMPDVDGFELTAWLCEEGASARLLVVSAESPVYAKWLTSLASVNGDLPVEVLTKPMSEASLVATLEGRPAMPVPKNKQEDRNDRSETSKRGRA